MEMSISGRSKTIHKLSNKTIEKVQKYKTIPFDKLSNWIEVGSGNFERTKDDGRYRDNCNRFHLNIACKDHKHESKNIYWHCGKLDCITCYIEASSRKARIINERLLEFQKEAMKSGIRTGRLVHFSLSVYKGLACKMMDDYDGKFLKFRQKTIYPMLRDMGIFGGVIFTHLRSIICQDCGEKESECKCEKQNLYKKFNPHFHVIGYGYIMNARKFKEKYPDFTYRNHGRRSDAYYTAFYILSKASLWRKSNGKLKPSYSYFNWLDGTKFIIIKKSVRLQTENCPICKEPRTIEKSKKKSDIGKTYSCKIIQRKFKILDLSGLRKVTKLNLIRFREDQKNWNKNQKMGNGYG